MDIKTQAQRWIESATEDADIVNELKEVYNDEDALYERFYQNLSFGTAGLRGVIGAGTNRMNIYTVRKATQGLANYINKNFAVKSVAISYDSRIKARLFSEEAARVLAANGIKTYITDELQPTPVLSFLVRELKCSAGIMITASHNPAKYNGYKCYGPDGCQMTDTSAGAVYDEIEKLDIFDNVKVCDYNKACDCGLIETVSDELYDSYMENVLSRRVNENICDEVNLKVVYTPLNGAGNKPVRKMLDKIGVKNVCIVKEQELPDGNFPTCSYPNPEFREALELGIELCKKENPDLLLATDPDSDRVGVAVKSGNDFRILTGNEIGVMLLEYILKGRSENKTLPQRPVAVKTIVSTILAQKVADKYGCEMRNVLTGFKYIGEQILNLEKDKEEERFVFGFEESYGYLSGTYVRDKDAVVASMLICELTAYYKKQGKSLAQVIDGIYDEYGYYLSTTVNSSFEGVAGVETMKNIMASYRENTPKAIGGYKVLEVADYLASERKDLVSGETFEICLPKANVLTFSLENGHCLIVRPSGTEPKIKYYITSVGSTKAEAEDITEKIKADL